jgi:hypothetical protein
MMRETRSEGFVSVGGVKGGFTKLSGGVVKGGVMKLSGRVFKVGCFDIVGWKDRNDSVVMVLMIVFRGC